MSTIRPGILISFEGTEGTGKSTLIRNLARMLQQRGETPTITREPGGTPLAERIRSLVLDHEMPPMAELFLYEAARADHVAQVIEPALRAGKIVLCDRFTDSTLAYQGYARTLSWPTIKTLNRIATNGLKPHLVVLLDLPPGEGLARVESPNRFEAEGLLFQTKVRKGFLKARAENPKRWLTLKVQGKTPEFLAERVLQEISRRFKRG